MSKRVIAATIIDKTLEKGFTFAKGLGGATLGRLALRIALRQPLLTLVTAAAAGVWYIKKYKQQGQQAST